MTAWRQAIELSIGDEDVARLVSITRSRTEPASRVDRARMLLAYRENASFFAVAHALGVHHQTVQRCVVLGMKIQSKTNLVAAQIDMVIVNPVVTLPQVRAGTTFRPDVPQPADRQAGMMIGDLSNG